MEGVTGIMTGKIQKMLLQWHITDHCNCRCTHCYQHDEQSVEPGWQILLAVIEQFKDLLRCLSGENNPVRGQITVTGGEPFLCPDFLKLLEVLANERQYFDFAILTNGTLLDRRMVEKLKILSPLFIQVSMEGAEHTHDSIRGQGNYRRTIEAIRHLVHGGIRTFVSFTAHRENFREFPLVASMGRKLRVDKVWADRHIPLGQGALLAAQMLTPEETREFFLLMQKERRQAEKQWFAKTKISMERGLQFLVGGGRPYRCAAGRTLLTVMPNGDVFPCRRMPVTVGNIYRQTLAEVYTANSMLQQLRAESTAKGCESCLHRTVCCGGLRCLAYTVFGEPWRADPGCWYTGSELL